MTHLPAYEAVSTSAEDVARALEGLRASDLRAMRTLSAAQGLTPSDVAALRLVVERDEDGEPVGPSDIARHLGLSSSAVSTLVERLVAHGSARVEAHPQDRRRKVVRPEPSALVEPVDRLVLDVAGELTARSRRIVVDFLLRAAEIQDERTRTESASSAATALAATWDALEEVADRVDARRASGAVDGVRRRAASLED